MQILKGGGSWQELLGETCVVVMLNRETILHEAEDFIRPAIGRRSKNDDQTILELVDKKKSDGDQRKRGVGRDKTELRRKLTSKALKLLHSLHDATIRECTESKNGEPKPIHEGRFTLITLGLLDFLCYEGILPFLSVGVGLLPEQRPRSVLKVQQGRNEERVDERRDRSNGEEILLLTVEGFLLILKNQDEGIALMIQERCLADLLAGLCELVIGPEALNGPTNLVAELDSILERSPTAILLPLLTSLLHPAAPLWMHTKLASTLSYLPLRENGARQIINFIAASYPTPAFDSNNGSNNMSQGLVLPLDALAQMSKLLSSVPMRMTPETYFKALAPQLWDLLEAKDDAEMRKAAGYIISSGILGRKALGAPDKIGWKLFTQPLLKAISPDKQHHHQAGAILTNEDKLASALRRLTTIILSHPSPGLTKRLLQPIILPLWGLHNYSMRGISASTWANTSSELLKRFLRLCAREDHLLLIADNLLWEGPTYWTFGPGSEGGIQINACEVKKEDPFKMLQSISFIDETVSNFLDLLAASDVESDSIITVFLAATRQWLLPESKADVDKNMLGADDESDPFGKLIYAKLAQAILNRFKNQFAKKPSKLIELLEQLLTEHLKSEKSEKGTNRFSGNAESKKLRALISESQLPMDKGSIVDNAIDEESTDMVVIALSLLDTIISTDKLTSEPDTKAALQRLLPLLESLNSPSSAVTTSSISTLAGNLAGVIRQSALPSNKSRSTSSNTPNDESLYNKALENLSSELAPIRVEGLATIQELIASRSSLISIPVITLLFIRNVLTDPDSFVHGAGARALVMLAAHDPRLTSRILADSFIDSNEEEGRGLDVRLAVGETLGSIVQAMTSDCNAGNIRGKEETMGWKIRGHKETRIGCDYATRTAVLRIIGLAMLRVGGRRGKRVKSKEARERKAALAAMKQKEANEAWGGEVPQLLDDEDDNNNNNNKDTEGINRETIFLQNILHGWENTGLEEDVRLRASALSILGQVLELHCTALDAGILASSVDLALQVVKSQAETGPERALVRRAAVMALAMLVRGVDGAYEADVVHTSHSHWRKGEALTESVNWQDVENTLRWTSEVDEDEMVKGHARAAVDGLEAWKLKRVLGVNVDGDGEMVDRDVVMRFRLGGNDDTSDVGGTGNERTRLAGLDINPETRKDNEGDDGHQGDKGKRRMVEEIE